MVDDVQLDKLVRGKPRTHGCIAAVVLSLVWIATDRIIMVYSSPDGPGTEPAGRSSDRN